MDDKRFWDVIAVACKPGADESEWHDNLIKLLKQLPPEDIVGFDRHFDDLTDQLYTVDHWGAAYLMCGGASDDGFYYWRCWLVGMGKKVYEAALADPDSLADVADPDEDYYEAEIYGVARRAWEELGLDEEEFDRRYDALGKRNEALLKGKDWDFDDDEEVRRHLPRLAAVYLVHLVEGDEGGEEDDD